MTMAFPTKPHAVRRTRCHICMEVGFGDRGDIGAGGIGENGLENVGIY